MTTEEKALALLGEVSPYKCEKVDHAHHAYLCAALRLSVEQHEAAEQELADCKQELADYKQKVSDAVEDFLMNRPTSFEQFIIPKPKPDPLVDIMERLDGEWTPEEYAKEILAALEARGLEIREKNDD